MIEDFWDKLKEADNKQKRKNLEKNKKELNKEIYEKVCKVIRRYIDTTEENIEILALWTIGTQFHDQFEAFPLLQLYAQKRSGKTRTLKLLSALCGNGNISTSITETFLFRHKGGALFFDELESINSKDKGTLRELLNSCYKKGNRVVRYKEAKVDGKKDYVEEEFFPYYPLALANVGGLNDILEDRAIQIILKRSSQQLTKLIEDFSTNPEIIYLKKELSELKEWIPFDFFSDWNSFLETKQILTKSLTNLFQKIDGSGLYGRILELFFPLFIIAEKCEVLDKFLKTAKDYSQSKEEEELIDDSDERLKQFIFKNYNPSVEFVEFGEFIDLKELLQGFKGTFETPEEWINSKWLGRALKRLGLIKKKRLVQGRVQIILNLNNSTNSTNSTNTTTTTTTTKTTNSTINKEEYLSNNSKKEGYSFDIF